MKSFINTVFFRTDYFETLRGETHTHTHIYIYIYIYIYFFFALLACVDHYLTEVKVVEKSHRDLNSVVKNNNNNNNT